MASTNPRFVSRPASHVPQVLTVATLAAAVGQKGVASATKAPPTSGHGPDVDFKKALSLQLQNALKLVISQNTATGGILTRQSPALNQDMKSSSSLRPQSAPATPVKGATTAAPSPASNTPTSIQSPLKSGTVAYKVAGTKVIPLSSKGSISVASTSQSMTTATTSLTSVKDKIGGPLQTESISKTSKLSAIESLLCEETISPKNSPGSVKIEKASVASTCTKPEVVEEEKKDEESKTHEDREKIERTDLNVPVAAQEKKVENSKAVEEREKVEHSESHPQKAASDAGEVSEKPGEQEKNANVYVKCDAREVVEDDTRASNEKEQTNLEAAVKKSIDEQPCPLSTSTAEEKANLDGSTTDSTKSSGLAKSPVKQVVKEGTVQLTSTSTSSSKTDTAKTEIIRPSKVQIKVLKSTPSPQPQPNPPTCTIASDKEEMVGVSRDEVSSKESEMIPPQVTDTLATPSQTMPTSVNPHKGKPPISTVVVTLARKRSPSPSCEAPPPAKKPALALKEGPAKAPTVLSQSSTLPSISTSTVALTSSITSTVTMATTAAVKVDVESPMDISTPSVDAEPSAQLQSEVSADSLIQSLCSDSTSFEEDPDVSVLASQLGLDSVDSPIFNLSGFLSLIQPDLSVLQPGVPESSSGGEQTLGKAPGSSTNLNIVEKIHPDEKKRGLGESTNRNQPQSVSSVLPPIPDSLASPLEAGATTLGLETDPTKFISTSPHQQPLTLSSDSSTPPLTQRVSEAATPALLSPVLLPEDPIPPPTRPLVLTLSDVPSLNQPLPSLGGAPTTPPPLTPTPLTPLGEGLLDISDIRSLVDESETMEGISQDVFESIEKLVNLDEQSTNATWK